MSGIHCNFFIVLPIRLKTCRFNDFLFFTMQNMHSRKIGRVSEILGTQARPIGIGRAISPGLDSYHQKMNIRVASRKSLKSLELMASF